MEIVPGPFASLHDVLTLLPMALFPVAKVFTLALPAVLALIF